MISTLMLFSASLALPPTVPPQAGLLLWLDAADRDTLALDGERVQAWKNKANLSSSLVAQGDVRPLYVPESDGMGPALRFDGRNDVLRDETFHRQAKTWTLMVVAAPFGPARGGGLCSATPTEGHDYDPGFTVDLYASGSRFDQLSVEGAGRIGGQQNQLRASYAYGVRHVVVVERDAEKIRAYVDGQPEGSRPTRKATTIMDIFRVGARCFGGRERQFFFGDVSEVLLYDRILTPQERESLAASRCLSDEEREKRMALYEALEKERAEDRMKAPVLIEDWPSLEAFEEETGKSLEDLPVRTDLKHALSMGMTHLTSLFDADRDDEPFFYANCRADGTGEMHHSVNIGIPHVVGRCLLGLAAGHEAAGLPFSRDALEILERYCALSFDNEDHLNSYIDPDKSNGRFIEFHNMREGLFGLWALMILTDKPWPGEKAEKMVRTLAKLTDEEGTWSHALLDELGIQERCFGVATPNAARVVDPLLAYHALTGDEAAMDLAGKYARKGLKILFNEDGTFASMDRSSGHVHSITSSLSGIVAYAVQTKDRDMLERCRRIMDRGVPDYFSSWGWGDEVFPVHPADELSRGEINQTGDVIRCALLLGQAGHPEYYGLAERYLRSMLLPTQHTEEELRRYMRDKENPGGDRDRDVIARSHGGYAMQLPNDRMREGDWPISTLDITSGAVHALAECWRSKCTEDNGMHQLNLLFNYEDDAIKIESHLPLVGRIDFMMKQQGALRIRKPGWAGQATMRRGDVDLSIEADGRYWVVDGVDAGARGTLTFDIPVRREKEVVDTIEYTTTWIGDQIIEILPRGTVSPLPF